MSEISDDFLLVISLNFTKIFPIILPKILTTFLVISPNLYFFFSFSFLTSFQMPLRMPPLCWMPRGVLFFVIIYPYFFDIYLCIFSENSIV